MEENDNKFIIKIQALSQYKDCLETEIDFKRAIITKNQIISEFHDWLKIEYNYDKKNIIIHYVKYFNKEVNGMINLDEDEYLDATNYNKILIGLSILDKDETNMNEELKGLNLDMNKTKFNVPYKDVIVLTANPLYDEENKRFLRTTNDFNKITYAIYDSIIENKNIKCEFMPLTEQNLKTAINSRPLILHLLCKSTFYNNEINLLFEDNNYFKMKAINEEKIKTIFNYKEGVQNTFLIISTQFSTDVFNLMKQFHFKDIFIQHTTLADLKYIEKYNEIIYKKLNKQDTIGINKLTDLFEDSNIIDCDKNKINYQFCFCCLSHKDNCELKNNINDELFISEQKSTDQNVKFYHYAHLRYQCCYGGYLELQPEEFRLFDLHKKICSNKEKRPKFCCKSEETNNFIKKEYVFPIKNKGNDFIYMINHKYKSFQNEFCKNYKKMEVLVQRSQIIYDVYNLLFMPNSHIRVINIYEKEEKERKENEEKERKENEEKESYINEFNDIVNTMIEYYKERNKLLNENNKKYKVYEFYLLDQKNLGHREKEKEDDNIIYFIIKPELNMIKDLLNEYPKNKFVIFNTKKLLKEDIKDLKKYLIIDENELKNIELNKISKMDLDIKDQFEKINKNE